jgi:hypothetical protein
MKRRIFSFFLLLTGTVELYAQPNTAMYDYIRNPPAGDSLCAKDLRKAEREIASGQLHLVQFADPRTPVPRYMQELQLLSAELKLPLVVYSGSSFIVNGQRRGCYAYRMDAEIVSRFGVGFSDSIRGIADRRFIDNHLSDTLNAAACDKVAAPVDPSFDPLRVTVPLDAKRASLLMGYDNNKAHLVLECIVDKQGNLVSVGLTNELPVTNVPGEHAGELLKIARDRLLAKGKWEPSFLGEYPVASRVVVGVYFVEAGK